jgi:Tol biopolymer transport system component
MSAICLLALAETTNTAKAASLPDNGKIAFTSNRSDYDAIYTVKPDGSNLSELTGGTYPNWSPDGTELAFIRQDADEGDISVMSADGSNLNNLRNLSLTSGPPNSGPTWSPDGTKIASESDEDIYTMDSGGSNQTNLTKTPQLRASANRECNRV